MVFLKIKLFTHTDLDGVGCAILGKLAFDNIDIEYCEYNNVNQKIEEFIAEEQYISYNKVYLTDISVNGQVAELINNLGEDNVFTLIDHHPTALWLNKYCWANIEEETILIYGYGEQQIVEKTSGTYSFLIELLENDCIRPTQQELFILKDFADTVRKYDTWLWKEKYNDDTPKKWNDLLYILGRDRFVDKVVKMLENNKFELDNTDKLLLELEQNKIDKYIEQKNKEIIKIDILNSKAGVIFGEQYHSEVGNKLSEMHPELDFIIIINLSKSVSYRTVKSDINLGKDIASFYGGGGHPKAAGSELCQKIREEVIELIFNL